MIAETGKNIRKIIMAFAAVLTILVLSVPVHAWSEAAFAYDPYTDTLTITANRELLLSDLDAVRNQGYEPKNLVIAEGVTSVEDEMFRSWHWLETISLPWSLRQIGARAFPHRTFRRVNYNGYYDRWEGIQIEEGNESLCRRVKFMTGNSLESIKITSMPHKTEYQAGEYFVPDGMIVKAVITHYGSGALEHIIYDYVIEQEGPLFEGQRRIGILYNNGCQEERTYVPVTVK